MGKNKHISKSVRQQQAERKQAHELALKDALRESRTTHKRFDFVIRQISRQGHRVDLTDQRLWQLHNVFRRLDSTKMAETKECFLNLLIFLHGKRSRMLDTPHYFSGLAACANLSPSWRRSLENWKPRTKSANRQFVDLMQHLLSDYRLPSFIYTVLCEHENQLFHPWVTFLGAGKSVRELRDMPLPYTRKMCHEFMQAPQSLDLKQALRYGQVKGFNGDNKLAFAVAHSWLGYKDFEYEPFWAEFIHLLVKSGMFDHNIIGPICDYLHAQLRGRAITSLKGMTLSSILRRSEAWHRDMAALRKFPRSNWDVSGYKLKTWSEGPKASAITFEMVELVSTRQLATEGSKMGHCVATYAQSCEKGATVIFSLRKRRHGHLYERIATIEVRPKLRRVVQAKARFNEQISFKARGLLGQWATLNNLTISPHL